MKDDDEYEVGYGKPPKKHQFKKGQSGNPRGRRKKQAEISADESPAAVLKRVDTRKISVNGRDYSPFELELMALQAKAAKGEVAASRQLSQLRKELGLLAAASPVAAGGVLLLPSPVPLDEWTAACARQQAPARERSYGKKRDDDE